ncbi:hypothetical protein R3P38DRAFT_3008872 [Favolaschia claudopus]|uniref:Uncharacterized protein n=1 Tax=Favolaschia claudopus TaxID=2862362 RepID=A0AAW0AL57_9AGAR
MYGFFPSPIPPWVSTLTHLKIENESRQLFHISADEMIYLSLIRTQPISLVHLHLDLSVNTVPTDCQIHISTLQFFAVYIDDTEGQDYLRDIMDFVDCPALTELVVIGSHGDQLLFVLNMSRFPRVSFPVLRSLSLINLDEDGCSCEQDMPHPTRTLSSHATPLFPALSSLVIINQCFTPQLVKEIMGTEALPWLNLKTLTLCPSENISGVRSAVGDAMRQTPQNIPMLRLSSALLFPSDWVEDRLDAIEVVDPEELVKPFSGYWRA